MIPQNNNDTYYKDDNAYHMEERSADHQPTELDHDDADRRTLDESQADEDEDDKD